MIVRGPRRPGTTCAVGGVRSWLSTTMRSGSRAPWRRAGMAHRRRARRRPAEVAARLEVAVQRRAGRLAAELAQRRRFAVIGARAMVLALGDHAAAAIDDHAADDRIGRGSPDPIVGC